MDHVADDTEVTCLSLVLAHVYVYVYAQGQHDYGSGAAAGVLHKCPPHVHQRCLCCVREHRLVSVCLFLLSVQLSAVVYHPTTGR
jgi:hypothetical protein